MQLFLKLLPVLLLACSNAEKVQSPVTKVVQLLQNLSEKLEQEAKTDSELHSNYICWYKKTVESKTVSNSAARARIESLNAYVEDITAGRVEFTSERKELQEEMNEIEGDLATAKNLRTDENADFKAATKEIKKAIVVLDDAIAFVAEGFGNLAQEESPALVTLRSDLRKTIQMGQGLLNDDQTRSLQKFYEEPFDYKTLNKYKAGATYSKQYETSTHNILDALKAMQKTFQENLDDAQAKEDKSQAAFETLSEQKEEMFQKAKTSYMEFNEEQGARALEKEQALEEKDDLTTQVSQDEQFIADVKAAHDVKDEEWAERKRLRVNELLAISKAIALLSSDSARDTFRESLPKVVSFLQESHPCLQRKAALAKALPVAKSVLLSLSSVDSRIHKVFSLMTNGTVSQGIISTNSSDGVALVMSKITELKQNLDAEEAADIQKQQDCEQNLEETSKQARAQAMEVDSFSKEIDEAGGRAESLSKQIEDEKSNLVELQDQLTLITRQRTDENNEFQKRKRTDEKAMQLLDDAATVLSKWMEGGGDAPQSELLQKAKIHKVSLTKKQEPSAADAAIAGAPETQEGAYAGAEADKGGILNILSLLKEDIRKELALATTEENTAQSTFETQAGAVEAAISAAESAIESYMEDRSAELQAKVDKTGERDSKAAELSSTVKQYHGLWPGCEFIQTNIDVRKRKRAQEMSGLDNALQILTTASENFVGVGSLLQQC